jgi:hypothetical protein
MYPRDMHSLPDLATGLPESRDLRESYDSCASRLHSGVGDYITKSSQERDRVPHEESTVRDSGGCSSKRQCQCSRTELNDHHKTAQADQVALLRANFMSNDTCEQRDVLLARGHYCLIC